MHYHFLMAWMRSLAEKSLKMKYQKPMQIYDELDFARWLNLFSCLNSDLKCCKSQNLSFQKIHSSGNITKKQSVRKRDVSNEIMKTLPVLPDLTRLGII